MKDIRNTIAKLGVTAAFVVLASTQFASAEALKIGVSTAETPPGNVIHGTEIREGVDIAAELINADGGVLGHEIELIFEDSTGTPEKGIAAVEKLILEEGVSVITGVHHSNVALAEIEVAHRNGVPYINTNAWSGSVRAAGYPEVFSPSNYSARSAAAMAETIKALGAKSIVAFTENTDYGIGQMEDLKALIGAEADISFKGVVLDRQAADYLPAIIPLRQNPPDVVLNIMVQPGAYKLINQLHELGVAPSADTWLYDGSGVGDAPDFWDNVSDAGVGMVSFGLFHPSINLSDWGQRVRDAYVEEYGREPGRLIFQAADSVLLAADAATRSGSVKPSDLVEALSSTNLQGSTGVISFAADAGPLFQQWIDVPYVTMQYTEVGQTTPDSTLAGVGSDLDVSLLKK